LVCSVLAGLPLHTITKIESGQCQTPELKPSKK